MVGARELQTLATSMEKHGFGDDHVASLQQFMLAANGCGVCWSHAKSFIIGPIVYQEKMRDEGRNQESLTRQGCLRQSESWSLTTIQ